MEYFLGSVITLIAMISFNLLLRKKTNETVSLGVLYSQSRLHELLKPLENLRNIVKILSAPEVETQSKKHNDAQHVKVIISETEAYWIANNKFYVADVLDSIILQETTREVDTMVMDDVQLNKIIEIVEMLGKTDDRGNTWNE